MTILEKLTNQHFADLKINDTAQLNFAARQHLLHIRALEVPHAALSYPLFVSRNSTNGNWTISALTSFDTGQNLYVKSGNWATSFQPTATQTYPLYLMESPHADEEFCIGIDPSNKALSTKTGIALFDDNKQPSEALINISKLLKADVNNDIQTFEFTKHLAHLDLLKAIDIQIEYKDSQYNTIQGLFTINEETLNALPTEQLDNLRNKGYLAPIYALLISSLQMNTLIKLNNADSTNRGIVKLKMEVRKNATAVS